jgi:predicted metal-binding protein
MNIEEKEYIAVIQCHLVKQYCSGYYCEEALFHRKGGFANYPKEKSYRTLYFTCGGCCGLATHRKLLDLIRSIQKNEKVSPKGIAVHLSSCITRDNYHGPVCPHLDYLKVLIEDKLKLDLVEGSATSKLSEKRRAMGIYEGE